MRVRAVSGTDRSEWRELTGITSDFELLSVAAQAVEGGAEFTATTPSNAYHQGVQIFRAATGAGFGAAVAVTDVISTEAGTSVTVLAGDPTATNEITNGTFDDGSDWTANSPWTISGGRATHPSTGVSTLAQSVGLNDGSDYRLTFTVLNRSAGEVVPRFTGGTNTIGTWRDADGTYQEELTAVTGNNSFSFVADASFLGDVDDVWLIENTAELLTQGEADFWIAPISANGTQGPEVGPFTLTIY